MVKENEIENKSSILPQIVAAFAGLFSFVKLSFILCVFVVVVVVVL
jgi:hypothetical protein